MKERIVGRIWWCGDYECDCTQPMVERITPNETNPRFIRRERLWEGAFVTTGCEPGEREAQDAELDEAIKRFGAEDERNQP